MVIGTAGFTALMCVMALERHGNLKRGDQLPVLVLGAAGGVGSFATAILTHLGYKVVASVLGKEKFEAHCRKLGAVEVIEALGKEKPLGKEKYAGVVDPVGGQSLTTALSQCAYGRAVACCGLAGKADFQSTVMPFILRGVKLLGIDSVQAPMDVRRGVWEEYGRLFQAGLAEAGGGLFTEVSKAYALDDVAGELGPRIMQGKIQGRARRRTLAPSFSPRCLV